MSAVMFLTASMTPVQVKEPLLQRPFWVYGTTSTVLLLPPNASSIHSSTLERRMTLLTTGSTTKLSAIA